MKFEPAEKEIMDKNQKEEMKRKKKEHTGNSKV